MRYFLEIEHEIFPRNRTSDISQKQHISYLLETEHKVFPRNRTSDISQKQNIRYFLETEHKVFPRNKTSGISQKKQILGDNFLILIWEQDFLNSEMWLNCADIFQPLMQYGLVQVEVKWFNHVSLFLLSFPWTEFTEFELRFKFKSPIQILPLSVTLNRRLNI